MPLRLLSVASLLPATILSVPIYDFAIANEELADEDVETYYPCCGKSICGGCIHSCHQSRNFKCPFCNSDRGNKTEEENNEDLMKRVEANDAASICLLAYCCYKGLNGVQQDHAKAIELYVRAAELGYKKAHNNLAGIYHEGGNIKKAKFHFEAAAMAGHEVARFNLGVMEANSGNKERAVKHWTIAASAGEFEAMHQLRTFFEGGAVSRETINTTLTAYNSTCSEIRSEARDAHIHAKTGST
jgi:tetratricopeptide (TPR) repeat protein